MIKPKRKSSLFPDVPLRCPDCRVRDNILFRVEQSRLEDGLGQVTYECEKCHSKFKEVK